MSHKDRSNRSNLTLHDRAPAATAGTEHDNGRWRCRLQIRPPQPFPTADRRIPYSFNEDHTHSLGVEIELELVDVQTLELSNAVQQILDRRAHLYDCHSMIAKQNRWHAARSGMDATFVDPDTMQGVPACQTVERLMTRCQPIAERFGCAQELQRLTDILERGNLAQRQSEVYQRTDDMRKVVNYLIEQGEAAVA